jgi:putative DNA primase/helicase
MNPSTSHVESVLTHVRVYAGLKLNVLLVHGIVNGECTCGNANCSSPGKHPLHSNGVYGATQDLSWLESQYNAFPYANVAIAAGRESGIIFLDLDTAEAIEAVRKMGVPVTWKFSTGKGEQHAFRYPVLQEELFVQNAVQIAPGIDIRSDGGYSVVPPSNHYSGRTYQWGFSPENTPLMDVPEWLRDKLIIKNKSASSNTQINEHAQIQTEGGRNDYLFKVGTSMRAARFSGEEIRLVLLERNARSCSPPLPEAEVNEIIDSIVQRYAPGINDEMSERVKEKLGDLDKLPITLLTAPLSDSGNAECLIELFGVDFRYCKAMTKTKSESKGVFHWNGSFWEEDIQREFRNCAMWTARGRKAISINAETVEERKRLYKFANDSENIGRLESMCDLASTNPKVSVREALWDTDPLKIGVRNGTLNLKTGEFEEPTREDYITKQSDVVYDEEKECPLWEKTLGEVFSDHPEIIPYLQRVFGYCLTGITDQHLMWFWYGGGANGKSTILNTIKALLGDLAATTSFSTFDTKNDNGRNDGLAELRGKRFVAASEGEQGRSIAEAKIKLVVSNDEVSCRFLFNNLFTYRPTYKVILASNHLPEIRGTDKGIWRRVHLVPFNQTFEGDARDPDLEEKLLGELSGILNWCLKGLQDFWERGGVDPPAIVLYSTRSLETRSDLFQQWFEERLTPNEGSVLRRSSAYMDYRNYLRTSGEHPLAKIAWTARMEEIGVAFTTKVRGDYSIKGYRLDSEVY